MHLTKEQVLETLKRYFPDEQWDDISEDETYLRLILCERATPEGETCLDHENNFVRYTGIGEG